MRRRLEKQFIQRNQAQEEYRRHFQSFVPQKQKKKIAITKYVAIGYVLKLESVHNKIIIVVTFSTKVNNIIAKR